MAFPTSWIVGIAILLILLFSGIAALLWTAPIFTTILFGVLGLVILFVVTENYGVWRFVHGALEHENRFWGIVAGVLGLAVFLAPDSPLSLAKSYPLLGILLVLMLIPTAHSMHRRKTTRKLRSASVGWALNELNDSDEEKKEGHIDTLHTAKEKTADIIDMVRKLGQYTPLLKPLHRKAIFELESSINASIAQASAVEINFILTHVNIARLLYKVKDNDIMTWRDSRSQYFRTALLCLITGDRLPDLDIPARASVLHGLQNMRLSAHTDSEIYVRKIFVATTGEDLTSLKCALDAMGGAQNLHKLLFTDITSESVRLDILEHFAREAKQVSSRQSVPLIKILSDVDDTLYASGGSWPAGLDASFPKHVLYPGVLTFYRELDLGYDSTGVWSQDRTGNLVFLSARPHVYKDVAEAKSYNTFMELHTRTDGVRMHCLPTLLAGDLGSGWEMISRDNIEPMARKKFSNFTEYHSLFPEYKVIFIGDNGQGDVRAGELMMETHADSVSGLLMHAIQPLPRTPQFNQTSVAKWAQDDIQFFVTYVGAATLAAERKLIHPSALHRVADSAKAELGIIFEKYFKNRPEEAEERRGDLNRDIEAANVFLATLGEQKLISCMLATSVYANGAFVTTSYGVGEVKSFRPASNTYHIILRDWRLSNQSRVHCYLHVLDMQGIAEEDFSVKDDKADTKTGTTLGMALPGGHSDVSMLDNGGIRRSKAGPESTETQTDTKGEGR